MPGFAGGFLRPFPIAASSIYPLSDAKAAYAAVMGSSRESHCAASESLIIRHDDLATVRLQGRAAGPSAAQAFMCCSRKSSQSPTRN
jgi:hypothetical protein